MVRRSRAATVVRSLTSSHVSCQSPSVKPCGPSGWKDLTLCVARRLTSSVQGGGCGSQPKKVLSRACLGNGTRRFAGPFKPSVGLEPTASSLPWRIRAAATRRRNSAYQRAFPAIRIDPLSGAPLPRRALSLPQKPRTCPQNLSPRSSRPITALWSSLDAGLAPAVGLIRSLSALPA